MNRKTVTAIALGVLAAAAACIIAGLIMYFTATHNAVLLLIGIFMIAMGSIMAIVPLIFLIIVLISVIAAKKNK